MCTGASRSPSVELPPVGVSRQRVQSTGALANHSVYSVQPSVASAVPQQAPNEPAVRPKQRLPRSSSFPNRFFLNAFAVRAGARVDRRPWGLPGLAWALRGASRRKVGILTFSFGGFDSNLPRPKRSQSVAGSEDKAEFSFRSLVVVFACCVAPVVKNAHTLIHSHSLPLSASRATSHRYRS